ncbi:T7SS effector LXG polymorphic toxin [Cytobacillus kochii]|uniref:T7SS effector LXG polymorphic toxin n=1 Tax=Cytobacillus kochii TaxID=859143 RepID=UPI0027863D14|nr:T7SS effector LXG polymorphic toxin [Cytobacillus kochii]MDQ0187837.1 putative ribonuclease toxin of YeeF-YezG toxin-antitoxin module [Cytobacillus kochii]
MPRLDDHRVHQHAQSATNQMTQTIERLHNFDQQQANKLEATAQDLSRLKSTISEIQTGVTNDIIFFRTRSIRWSW